MSMRIDDICTYAPKSGIKAGEATKNGQYMFFTSSEDETKRYTDYQYDGEGIIMGTGGNATLHYYHGKYAVSTDCIVLSPDDRIRCKYLYYYFLANMPILEAGFKGAGLKHTNKKYIGSITIPVIPPIDEQDCVIEALDKIIGIIKARKLEIAALEDLIKARFVEMFGDPVTNSKGLPTKVGRDFFKLSNGKSIPELKRLSEGVPAYGGNGVSWFTDEAMLNTDTLVVGRVGFQSGNVHYATGPLSVTDNAMYVSSYDSSCYDLHFLCDCMEHINFTRFQDPGDLKKITQKPFMEMEYISPALEQQLEYLRFVSQVDKSKAAIQKALDKTQLLFDSLMQEYFG